MLKNFYLNYIKHKKAKKEKISKMIQIFLNISNKRIE